MPKINPYLIEVKAAGFDLSVGKKMGISLPFGEVSVDLRKLVLCSKCYKKIPKGKEVAKTAGYWKVSWWGRDGNEIYCKKCATKQDRRDQVVLIVFYLFPLTFFLAYSLPIVDWQSCR